MALTAGKDSKRSHQVFIVKMIEYPILRSHHLSSQRNTPVGTAVYARLSSGAARSDPDTAHELGPRLQLSRNLLAQSVRAQKLNVCPHFKECPLDLWIAQHCAKARSQPLNRCARCPRRRDNEHTRHCFESRLGMSLAVSHRCNVVTPRTLSLPVLLCANAGGKLMKQIGICPPIRSVRAGAPPL